MTNPVISYPGLLLSVMRSSRKTFCWSEKIAGCSGVDEASLPVEEICWVEGWRLERSRYLNEIREAEKPKRDAEPAFLGPILIKKLKCLQVNGTAHCRLYSTQCVVGFSGTRESARSLLMGDSGVNSWARTLKTILTRLFRVRQTGGPTGQMC